MLTAIIAMSAALHGDAYFVEIELKSAGAVHPLLEVLQAENLLSHGVSIKRFRSCSRYSFFLFHRLCFYSKECVYLNVIHEISRLHTSNK